MSQRDQIWNKCLRAVEAKFGEGPYEQWTKSTYERLSERISDEAGMGVSSSTLKRIFGKVKYEHKPQQEVKNALARYIGFPSWMDFVVAEGAKSGPQKSPSSTKSSNKSKLILGIVGVIVVGLIAYFIGTPATGPGVFSIESREGMVPFQAKWTYDITPLGNKDVYIDYNDVTHMDDIKLDPEKHAHTRSFRNPDVYYTCFKYKNEQDKFDWVGCNPVVVYSNGWHASLINYYVDPFHTRNLRKEDTWIHNNCLNVDKATIAKYGFDTTSIYWTKYRYVKDFQLPSDDFSCEVMVKLETQYSGTDCPEIIINLMGDNNEIETPFSYPGCGSQDAHFTFGDVYFTGRDQAMEGFQQDLTNWSRVNIRIKDMVAEFKVNGKVVHTGPFTGHLGNIKGIMLQVRGQGEIDYVRLYNRMGAMVFNDEFGAITSDLVDHIGPAAASQ